MDRKPYVIAIDGPAGSGKSTVAREVGKRLGIQYLDSGAFYRALTLHLWRLYSRMDTRADFSEWSVAVEESTEVWGGVEISLEFGDGGENLIFIDGIDVSQEIRTPEVTEKIKYVADKARYREYVNNRIRLLAESKSLVMDGRDIGTEVFPLTPYKFFLTASPEERARRRFTELQAKNIPTSWEEVFQDMVRRDQSDENRKIAPLRRAKDAILVDTDTLSIKVVIETILSELSRSRNT